MLLVVSIVHLLVLPGVGPSHAADSADGEWTGSATPAQNGRCKSASVTLTVTGNQAIGEAKFDGEARTVNGTVRADGSFGGTIGFQHLTGQFIDDRFEGAFRNPDCAWMLILRRNRPRTPTSGRPSPRDPRRLPMLAPRIVMPS